MENTVPPIIPITPSEETKTPPTSPLSNTPNKRMLLLIGAVLVVVILGIGYYYSQNLTTKNATVYNSPTEAVTQTPTPTLNPKDTSNAALENDTSASGNDLNNVDSSLNDVDQSLNDQPTNLQ